MARVRHAEDVTLPLLAGPLAEGLAEAAGGGEQARHPEGKEAGDGPHNRFEQFDPALRMEVDVGKLQFLVLEKMWTLADDLYRGVRERKSGWGTTTGGTTEEDRKWEKKRPLREREPW